MGNEAVKLTKEYTLAPGGVIRDSANFQGYEDTELLRTVRLHCQMSITGEIGGGTFDWREVLEAIAMTLRYRTGEPFCSAINGYQMQCLNNVMRGQPVLTGAEAFIEGANTFDMDFWFDHFDKRARAENDFNIPANELLNLEVSLGTMPADIVDLSPSFVFTIITVTRYGAKQLGIRRVVDLFAHTAASETIGNGRYSDILYVAPMDEDTDSYGDILLKINGKMLVEAMNPEEIESTRLMQYWGGAFDPDLVLPADAFCVYSPDAEFSLPELLDGAVDIRFTLIPAGQNTAILLRNVPRTIENTEQREPKLRTIPPKVAEAIYKLGKSGDVTAVTPAKSRAWLPLVEKSEAGIQEAASRLGVSTGEAIQTSQELLKGR